MLEAKYVPDTLLHSTLYLYTRSAVLNATLFRRHEGVFIARGKEDALVTKNLVPGSEVYGEKRISVEVCSYSGICSTDLHSKKKLRRLHVHYTR